MARSNTQTHAGKSVNIVYNTVDSTDAQIYQRVRNWFQSPDGVNAPPGATIVVSDQAIYQSYPHK